MSKFEPTIETVVNSGNTKSAQLPKENPENDGTDFSMSEKNKESTESVSDKAEYSPGKDVVRNYRGIKEWITTYEIQDLEDLFKKEGFSTSRLEDKQYESILKSYKGLLSPFGRYTVKRIFGIKLVDFSILIQLQFLNFLNNTDETTEKRVAIFLKNGNSEDRLKSFLSLEQGGAEMGEKILAIGEKLPKETADRVFAKYAEMAEVVGSLENSLREYYEGEKRDTYIHRIGERILERAKNILVRFSELDAGVDEKTLLKNLDRERANIAVFLATYKVLRKEGKMSNLEELPGVNFQAMTGRDLASDSETLREMRSIYEENYSAYPKEFREKIVGSLEERMKGDTTFYLLRKDGQLLAFDAFTRKDAETLSFGSFNIIPEAQGNTLADGMIEATVLKHGKEWKLVAECDARKPISKKYIEYGFVVKGTFTAHFSDGDVPVLVIERDLRGDSAEKESVEKEAKEVTAPLEALETTLAPFFSEGFTVTQYDNRDVQRIACTLERPLPVLAA